MDYISNGSMKAVSHEDDYPLIDVIVSALMRTSDTVEIINESRYFSVKLKELPDRTTWGTPIFIFNESDFELTSEGRRYKGMLAIQQFILECV